MQNNYEKGWGNHVINLLKVRGIFQRIERKEIKVGETIFIIYELSGLAPKDTDGHYGGEAISAYGVSIDENEALSKACGEFLERFPFLFYKKSDFLFASIKQLKNEGLKFLNPINKAGFTINQKKARPEINYDDDTIFSWVEGKTLSNQKKALIPAQLVFWNYCRDYTGWTEKLLGESNTSGLAGGFTLQEAQLAAIYELIQRDGFFIYWLNNKSPPKVNLNHINNTELNLILSEIKRLGLKSTFLDITTDLNVSSYACCLVNESSKGPFLSMGAACNLDPVVAIKSSLEEALMIRNWATETKKESVYQKDFLPPSMSKIGLIERAHVWTNPPPAYKNKMLSFLSSDNFSSTTILVNNYCPDTVKSKINFLINKLRSMGESYEVYFYAANNPLLQEGNFESVRVIIPALIPLYMNEANAPLGSQRLFDVPKKLGFSPSAEFNGVPHPFL